MIQESDLSSDQRAVFQEMLRWSRTPTSLLTVGGYAGSGKSTLLGLLAARLRGQRIAYAAYTGRAAAVLRRKLADCGVDSTPETRRRSDVEDDSPVVFCGTLHKLMYKAAVDQETDELLGFGNRHTFDRPYRMIVIDEASMVSDVMLKELQAFGVPVLAVGDHGQLPPVMALGSLMQSPMLRLETIHRQALNSPIIRMAHEIRIKGEFRTEGIERITRLQLASLPLDLRSLSTGMICWTNRTRIALNRMAREMMKLSGAPGEGEIVVCLKNRPPIYNGMRGRCTRASEVSDLHPWVVHGDVEFPEEGLSSRALRMCRFQFLREKTFSDLEDLQSATFKKDGDPWLPMADVEKMTQAGDFYDFGYAMTTHKCQGSQFNHAIVVMDRAHRPNDEDWRRWMYTSVTRAVEKLTLVS